MITGCSVNTPGLLALELGYQFCALVHSCVTLGTSLNMAGLKNRDNSGMYLTGSLVRTYRLESSLSGVHTLFIFLGV